MNLTRGIVIAGEQTHEQSKTFTIQTGPNAQITIGESVVALTLTYKDEENLRCLRKYLKDRPALMDDTEVKQGIRALNTILGTPTEDL